MLRMLGDPSPSKGGEDFFQKSLGDPWTIGCLYK